MAVDEESAGVPASREETGAGRMTLVEHLTELRKRLVISVVAVTAGMVVGFFLYERILDVLQDPYCQVVEDCDFLVQDPLGGFSVRMRLAGYVGFLLASPVVLWQLWRFITPGLYPHEKRYAIPFVASSVVLFVLGAALALWTFPNALEFLINVGGDRLNPEYSPTLYLRLITVMMLAFGIAFEFPILLIFLQMAGVLSPEQLSSWRRPAIVGIVVFVAVITPSGDPYTLIVLAVPMIVFYEGAILIGRLLRRRKRRSQQPALP